jgi:NAD(P)-dependent dehydrogenase (short-subunit alcohol dehydrogenase family)
MGSVRKNLDGESVSASADRGAVVVTGTSTGIGRACALALDAHGFRVFAGVRREEDAAALRRAGSDRLTPVFVDVTDAASIAAAAATVARAVGDAGLAGLVNNAGVGIVGPLEYLPPDDLRWQLDVNVVGQLAVTQAFLPLLHRGCGRIVNIGSVGGKLALPFGGALCASKHALEALTDALRLELRPWGIHVCLVEPGSIHTEAVDKTLGQGERTAAALARDGHDWYAEALGRFAAVAAKRERGGSPPTVVATTVIRALTVAAPRARYPVGAHARLLTTLPRVLPDRALDAARLRLFSLPRAFGVARS